MYKPHELSKLEIAALPDDVKTTIAESLTCFDMVFVSFNFGKYSASTATCISNTYAPDHKELGIVTAKSFYSAEERLENYVNCFHDYPFDYRGPRDYTMLKKLNEDRTLRVKLDSNGILQII